MTIDDYIRKLEDTLLRIQELEIQNEYLSKQKEQLEKENEDLKKRLLFYKNPNTLPSARKIQTTNKTSAENLPVPKKRGAPNGLKEQPGQQKNLMK